MELKCHCANLKCAMCRFDIFIYCKMITTVASIALRLASHHVTTISLFVVRTFKIYSLGNF